MTGPPQNVSPRWYGSIKVTVTSRFKGGARTIKKESNRNSALRKKNKAKPTLMNKQQHVLEHLENAKPTSNNKTGIQFYTFEGELVGQSTNHRRIYCSDQLHVFNSQTWYMFFSLKIHVYIPVFTLPASSMLCNFKV